MKHSFYLKNPQNQKGEKPSLIYFTCHFNKEKKKFVYSTGETIAPINWNFDYRQPYLKGKHKAPNNLTVNTQLLRYTQKFEETKALYSKINEEFTSKILRDAFDLEFKKISKKNNSFFDAYDEFMEEKNKRKEWKQATNKRYVNIKNHLIHFEKYKKYKLTFSTINNNFDTEFKDFCYRVLDHSTNTFARNLGLFKTFMFWALKNKYTYNSAFIDFKKPERVITKEIALNLDQVNEIHTYQTKSLALEKVKDVFVFQCLTGLRYGELKRINKRTVTENSILIKEEKDVAKEVREIPLFEVSKSILEKYEFQLPLISNQKQNQFIKEIFKNAEFTFEVEYSRTKNREHKILKAPFYKRVSTHTARRTFITILKNKGVADKTIMEMTGHKDFKTFNSYYKVDNLAKHDAINKAFSSIKL